MPTTRLRRPIRSRSWCMVLAAAALTTVVATRTVSSAGPAGGRACSNGPTTSRRSPPPTGTTSRAAHLLERAGFGGTPEEIARLAAMTPRQAVDSPRRFRIDRRAI